MLRERHPSCCACRRYLHGLDGECPTGRDGARGRAALCCAVLCCAVQCCAPWKVDQLDLANGGTRDWRRTTQCYHPAAPASASQWCKNAINGDLEDLKGPGLAQTPPRRLCCAQRPLAPGPETTSAQQQRRPSRPRLVPSSSLHSSVLPSCSSSSSTTTTTASTFSSTPQENARSRSICARV